MRLVELSILPVESTGWGSQPLRFGEDITQLYGPNGCGKTPIIHSIAYAMGYPVRYRDDIIEHCESITLKAVHDGKEVCFVRKLGNKFHTTCSISTEGEVHHFYNEQEMSVFLIEFLGLPVSALTSLSNEPAYPYISTFLPLFYVDQDSGYTSVYKAPSSFIKDQYAEMIRLSLGIPVKHSYEEKRNLIEKKAELDAVNRNIVRRSNFVDKLVEQAGANLQEVTEIDGEIKRLVDELDQLRSSHDATSGVDYALSNRINEKLRDRRAVDLKIRDFESRILDFSKIKVEIETEINTLSLNEEARRLFASFSDICANPNCGLFLNSSESYGKNLLYLRDQMKDLDRNTTYQEARLSELRNQSRNLKSEADSLQISIKRAQESETSESLVNAISEMTRSIFDLQQRKEMAIQIREEQRLILEASNRRQRLQNDIAAIAGGVNEVDLRATAFRVQYRAKLIEWLDILSTKNVSRNINIDSDFNVIFGSEKLAQFSGSTLLRAVLALKAAFFEVYLTNDNSPIEFMIFDTPRQHDIESEHFAAFVGRLKGLVAGTSAQIVFSTTEYHYENRCDDVEWTPPFPGIEQNMFLGTVAQLSQ